MTSKENLLAIMKITEEHESPANPAAASHRLLENVPEMATVSIPSTIRVFSVSELLQNNWLYTAPATTTYRVNLNEISLIAFTDKVLAKLLARYLQPPLVFNLLPQLPDVICISPLAKPFNDEKYNDTTAHRQVIVDAVCGQSVMRGAHVYAPGVLAMEAGTGMGEEVLVYADIEGKCRRGLSTRYDSSRKLLIGVGFVRMQRHHLFAGNGPPSGLAIEMRKNSSCVPIVENINTREALLQNLPSIVAVHALNPKVGDVILDMCAAPGNKTRHIAELTRDMATIIALDLSKNKVRSMRDRMKRLNHLTVKCFAFDSTMSVKDTMGESDNTMEPPFDMFSFDRILLDAPCSALGTRPLLRRMGESELAGLQSFPRLQRKLFLNAVDLLRPGGTLVYSTCTVTIEENEAIVAWALNRFPCLKLVQAEPVFGGPAMAVPGLSSEQAPLCQRFGCPTYNRNKMVDSIGFFIAKFVKNF